jgi:hypothetical protein
MGWGYATLPSTIRRIEGGKRPRRTIVDTKSFTRQSAKKSYPPVEVMVGERSKTERKRRRQVAVKSQQNKEVCCLVSW